MRLTIIRSLNKLVLSLICIVSMYSPATAQVDYQIGNGTNLNSYTSYPSPMADWYESDRHQFLFRASELQAAGIPAGVAILGIKWDVKDLGLSSSRPLVTILDYEITIGGTTATDLGGGYSSANTTVVRASANYKPNIGINSFTLPTPFIWNGTDNIVIQTCHGQGQGQNIYTSNASVQYGTYFSNATRYYYSDNSGRLCNTSSGNTTSARPNTIFTVGLPCNDTPKTSVQGPDKICPNKPFSLKPADYYAQASYAWEYSTDGISWSNFTGVPSITGEIKDSITSAKWYRVTITCDGNTNLHYTTAPHKVRIAPFYYCYCDNKMDDDKGADIGNVTIINSSLLDTIFDKSKLVTGTGLPVYNNAQASQVYTPYHDSLAWPCLYRDSSFIFHVSQIHPGSSFEKSVVQAYIDYNRDGLYDPNNEQIFLHALDGTGTPPQILKTSTTVPTNAKTGPTGLRIIISEDTIKAAPCGVLTGYGEVEDYIVEICYRPCDGLVNAGNVISTDTSMCSGYEYTLTDTTYEKARSGFDRSWQISGDTKTWLNIPNSMNKDTLNRVFAGQPLYYRLRTICLPTHDTNYSNPSLINTKPGYKCYCYSKAIGGSREDTSDIGGVTIGTYSNNSGGPHLLNPNAVYPRTDHTDDKPIELFADSLYKFYIYQTMDVAEHGDAKITVFMDFDNDKEYNAAKGERIYTGYTTIGEHTLVDSVIIPYNAITDVPTGMRVILNNDVGPNVPSDEGCGAYTSGETEDYLLIFRRKWGVNVQEVATLTGFNVHPNPTNGKFYVQFSTAATIDKVQVRVTSVTGQLIEQRQYHHTGGMFYQQLDMSGQSSGVYFVELQADGQRLMRKLVVQ